MDFDTAYNFSGLVIGVVTFVIIGVFHPIVIKAEYYFGTRLWWIFLAAGLGALAASLFTGNILVSVSLGVFGFSALWGIGELFEQRKRVEKGWFPRNPRRKDKPTGGRK
ncbi:MAG: DUF4491 family protein [Alistipes sp.]|nr:DUF4491 family protein [Alistipes sp.]